MRYQQRVCAVGGGPNIQFDNGIIRAEFGGGAADISAEVSGQTVAGLAVPSSNGTPESESDAMAYDSKRDPLTALSKGELITLLRRHEWRFDQHDLAVMCAAVMERLRTMNARAREGVDVMEASSFVRWAHKAGFGKLFQGESRDVFNRLASDTIWACESAWKNSPLGAGKEELKSTQEKLDAVLEMLAKGERTQENLASPVLRVIERP